MGTAPIQSAIETLLENPSTLADKEQTETEGISFLSLSGYMPKQVHQNDHMLGYYIVCSLESLAQVLPSIGLVNYETIKFPKCSAFESTHRREPQGIDDETANQSEPQGIDDETAHESDPQGIDEGI